jgi:hypothetical protein
MTHEEGGLTVTDATVSGFNAAGQITSFSFLYEGATFAARAAQHLRNTGMSIQHLPYGRMDYFSAKALEQRLIELGGGPGALANRINSIATSNPLYQAAQGWANNMISLLKGCGASAPTGIHW